MPTAGSIYADRSRMVTRQKCKRERWLGYHKNGKGLAKKGGKYAAEFGILMHNAIAGMLLSGKPLDEDIRRDYKAILNKAIDTSYKDALSAPALEHMKLEQWWLFDLLQYGWGFYHLEKTIKEYEIVDVEQEKSLEFQPADYLPQQLASIMRPLKFPLKIDALLKQRTTGMLFILDFKTASSASEDWNIALDNSLQSCLYTEAAETILGEYIGGMIYSGLVKGKREMDKAKSSPFTGQVIQYGSFLYGWQAKDGKIYKDYVAGRQRVFLPMFAPGLDVNRVFDWLNVLGFKMQSFFPMTIPWKPLNSVAVVGQQIVAENTFQADVELLEDANRNTPAGQLAEAVLMEQTLDNCYKYGSRHPCQFVEYCHRGLHPDELKQIYEPREAHHTTEND